MLLLIALLLVGALVAVLAYCQKFRARRKTNRKIAVLGRPSRGKLLMKLAAQARIDYPGQSEAWYWRKAQQDLKRYRG